MAAEAVVKSAWEALAILGLAPEAVVGPAWEDLVGMEPVLEAA